MTRMRVGKYAVEVSLKGHDTEGSVKDFADMLSNLGRIHLEFSQRELYELVQEKQEYGSTQGFIHPMMKLSKDKETGEPDGKYRPLLHIQD